MALATHPTPPSSTPVAPPQAAPPDASPISPFTLHPSPFPTPLSSLAADPDFAPFGDLSNLLKMTRQAEARLSIHFSHKHPRVANLEHLDASVQTLGRITAVRKTLIDLYRTAHAPLPEPRQAATPSSNPEHPAPSSNPVNSPSETRNASFPIRNPSVASVASVASISVCPLIPGAKDPARALAAVSAALDKLDGTPSQPPTPRRVPSRAPRDNSDAGRVRPQVCADFTKLQRIPSAQTPTPASPGATKPPSPASASLQTDNLRKSPFAIIHSLPLSPALKSQLSKISNLKSDDP